jgi:hypothetical protein
VLRERVFEIGGVLTMALGGLFVVWIWPPGNWALYFPIWITAGWLFAFGAFFVWVGRSARAARRRELQMLEPSEPGPPHP